ncbi:MAG: kinase [Lachnospiraceae bacterium]|nr:kinase [Lachnospiraceae bacterium]
MIISKTPFRISFFGGGTDFPEFFNEFNGKVISTTIDKYCYVNVRKLPQFFDYTDEIIYSKVEQVKDIEEINHPMVKNCLKLVDIKNIKVYYDADLPARTGLGTSSSFAVGLINCLLRLKNDEIFKIVNTNDGMYKYKEKLTNMAIHVERDMCNEAGGIQDQIAASFGNFNIIYMGKEYNSKYTVKKIPISYEDKMAFNDNLMLFFTGISRNSFEIQSKTLGQININVNKLLEMNKLVDEAYESLVSKDFDSFGKLLDYTWQLKRGLNNNISNNTIDNIYNEAKDVGAYGGKLLGAGGGGFMLFYIKKELQDKLRGRLKNLLEIPFKFDEEGSKIIYKTN